MFEGVSHSRLDGSRLVLSGNHGHWQDVELDGAVLHLRGTSNDLVLRTITEFDSVWLAGGERISAELYVRHTNYVEMPTLRPVSLAENSATRFGISAEVLFGSQHVYGFQGERFLGRAQKAFLYVVSADTTRAAVEFHGGDESSGASPFVNISIQLSYEVFQSTFKPLWLGCPHATVDVTVGVCGFRQRGHSLDDEDARDFVMASGAWSAELKSLSLAITSRSS
jgi:hypothetical protein